MTAGLKKHALCYLLLTLFLTAFDQLTKYLADVFLKGNDGLPLIPGVFELVYLENRGAAWGMLKDMRWLFLLLSAALLILVAWTFGIVPQTRSYRMFRILASVFAAGTLGNALDRLFKGYVVDFFYLALIDFPIFNMADCFITFSLFLLLIYYRNEDFSWAKKS